MGHQKEEEKKKKKQQQQQQQKNRTNNNKQTNNNNFMIMDRYQGETSRHINLTNKSLVHSSWHRTMNSKSALPVQTSQYLYDHVSV